MLQGSKRISFDDEVQVIGVSEPDIDIENEKMILKHLQKQEEEQQQQPKKLLSKESFLQDLGRVMNKKFQVAEKCQVEMDTSPHQVCGPCPA